MTMPGGRLQPRACLDIGEQQLRHPLLHFHHHVILFSECNAAGASYIFHGRNFVSGLTGHLDGPSLAGCETPT